VGAVAKGTKVATGGIPASSGDSGLLSEGTGDDIALAVDDLAGLAGPDSMVGASRFLNAKADGTN
jgi:hypothetical protein